MSEPKAPTGAALLVATAAVAMIAMVTAGCGRVEPLPKPHADRPASPAPTASPSDEGTYPTMPEAPYPSLTTAAPPATGASPCAGRPSASQVIAALRRDPDLRPPAAAPRVVTGPLCAGSWQYTVLDLPGQGRLQVVTRDSAGSLTVVTAGTYVCTPEVKAAAPAGITAATGCQQAG